MEGFAIIRWFYEIRQIGHYGEEGIRTILTIQRKTYVYPKDVRIFMLLLPQDSFFTNEPKPIRLFYISEPLCPPTTLPSGRYPGIPRDGKILRGFCPRK